LPTAPVVLHVSAVTACHLHFRTDAESSTSHSPFVSGCSGTITWKGKAAQRRCNKPTPRASFVPASAEE
jgi:hypothetical protein